MKIIAAFEKREGIAYTSHLDVQRTLQRTFRRANIPLAYSKGFNPHPKLSFATALATGYTSSGEWFEVEVSEPIALETFVARVNAAFPNGMRIVQAFVADASIDTLSKLLRAACYTMELTFSEPVAPGTVHDAVLGLMAADAIIVDKRTKSGIKSTDIRPDIMEVLVEDVYENVAHVKVIGRLTASGGLRAETIPLALSLRLGVEVRARIHRSDLYFEGCHRLPMLP